MPGAKPASRGPVEWRWADLDGTARATTLQALAQAILEESLPPYILVWRRGWLEWLPGYLVPELADILGVESAGVPTVEQELDTPPPAPLEWYMECLGPSSAKTLNKFRASRTMFELDWSESFASDESPTVPKRSRYLPVGAFRDIDAYLEHLRGLRRRH